MFDLWAGSHQFAICAHSPLNWETQKKPIIIKRKLQAVGIDAWEFWLVQELASSSFDWPWQTFERASERLVA